MRNSSLRSIALAATIVATAAHCLNFDSCLANNRTACLCQPVIGTEYNPLSLMQLFIGPAAKLHCGEHPTLCTLLLEQPNVMALWGIAESTVFAPTEHAFHKLRRWFPAFDAWLHALPSCKAYNRIEHFLLTHSSPWTNLTCAFMTAEDKIIQHNIPAYASGEFLSLGWEAHLEPPWVNDTDSDNDTLHPECHHVRQSLQVETKCAFFPNNASKIVHSYRGWNGHLHFVDKVLTPLAPGLGTYPTLRLEEYICSHPDLTILCDLMHHLDLFHHLFHDHPHRLHYITFFAPVNSAFLALPNATLAALFDSSPYNVSMALQILLTHIVAGNTYLYQCPFFDANSNFGNITLLMQSCQYVTFQGVSRGLSMRVGQYNIGGFPTAGTIYPWVDIELLDGILHKTDHLLIPDTFVHGITNATVCEFSKVMHELEKPFMGYGEHDLYAPLLFV